MLQFSKAPLFGLNQYCNSRLTGLFGDTMLHCNNVAMHKPQEKVMHTPTENLEMMKKWPAMATSLPAS